MSEQDRNFTNSFPNRTVPGAEPVARAIYLPPLAPAVCCLLAVIVTISPWMIRNVVVFHKFIPIRDNLPLEFRVGNTGDSSEPLIVDAGPWVPWIDNTEWNEYTNMGEIAYFHLKGEQAKAYIEAHPMWYAGMMARRFAYEW